MTWRDRLFGTKSDRGAATGTAATIAAQKARAAKAVELHSSGRMSLEQAIEHMTGRKSMFWTGPDSTGFIPLAGFSSDALDDALACSTWFYSCVVANARAASDLPAIVQRKDGKGEWQRDRTHPLNELLTAPFGNTPRWPRWSWKQFTQTVYMQLPGLGNSFLKPSVVRDTPTQQRITALFLVMRPGAVRAIIDPVDRLINGWELGDGSPQLGPDELVNIMAPTAGSLWDGIAPMQVATKAIETDAIAASRQRWNMENRVSHGVIISIEDEWGFGATSTQETAILDKLAEQYTASADDGKPIILGKGAKISAPPTSEELQVFDTRNFSKKEIMAVCGTPPMMIGDYDAATLQNFDKAIEAWWDSHLFPMSHDFYGAVNGQAVWPIYGTDIRLWYDVSRSQIGVRLMKARAEAAQMLKDLGYTANTAAAEAGLDLPFVKELEKYNTDLERAGRTGGDEPPAVTEPEDEAE